MPIWRGLEGRPSLMTTTLARDHDAVATPFEEANPNLKLF